MRIENSALETGWMVVLRQARLDNGIRQVFVANAIGISPYLLSMWEMQDRAPRTFAAWNCWASFFRLPPLTPPTHDEQTLAVALRAARMARGLSAKTIADRLGIDRSGLCHWERRRSNPASMALWNRWSAAVGAKPIVAHPPESADLLYGHRGVLGYAPFRRGPCGCIAPPETSGQYPFIEQSRTP